MRMKFIACVKLTPDTEQLAEVRPEKVSTGDLGVTMVLNPWDEYAVEEVLQLAERYDGDTVAITVGNEDFVEALKRAIAMGVGEAVLLSDPAFAGSDAWGTADILAQAIKQQDGYALVLTGKQSVDGNSGTVGAGLACKLGIPYVSNVIKIEDVSAGHAVVRRMLDEGVQTVKVSLPAVISVSIEINEPRYPNFMGIRKASRMKYPAQGTGDIPGLESGEVGAGAALVKWTDLRKPPKRGGLCEFIQGASVVEQATSLVDKLIADKVI
jgi:electron transfer flavoprotein beta subunit